MTNRERFNNMTDEQLAEFITKISRRESAPPCLWCHRNMPLYCRCNGQCEHGVLDWLKSEKDFLADERAEKLSEIK